MWKRANLVLAAAGFSVLVGQTGKPISTSNCGTEEVGVLVWGQTSSRTLPEISTGNCGASISITGVSTHASAANEITAFAKGHPPVRQPVNWGTTSPVSIAFAAETEIKIQFWVLHKTSDCDFACQSLKTAAILVKANSIFYEERTGIRLIEGGPPVDLTGSIQPSFQPMLDLSTLRDCGSQAASELAKLHKTPQSLNIYVIRTVGGLASNGTSCREPADSAYVASRVHPGTGAHEIGHKLGLVHPMSGSSILGRKRNLMHPDSASRKYLTEGQVYWMHFSNTSALPQEFGLRTSEARQCITSTPDPSAPCPKDDARIWPDN